jgi:hypothetical protein
VEQKKRALFKIENGYLYIANDGNEFTREGVIALSTPNLSEKSDKLHDRFPGGDDSAWIDEHTRKHLEGFINEPNRLTAEAKRESGASADYRGRWLLELLQNIDDAQGPKDISRYIGTKGLGFLSIFELGEDVEVFSGPFNFTFSATRTWDELNNAKFPLDGFTLETVPKMSFPWPTLIDNISSTLRAKGYSTIMRVKLYADKENDVKEKFKKIDPYFLLLNRNIKEITFEANSYTKRLTKKIIAETELKAIGTLREDIQITVDENKKNDVITWRKWGKEWETEAKGKLASTAICLPLENGKPTANTSLTGIPIYNFYPTDEVCETSAVIHATFELTQDRKQLQMYEQGKWSPKKDRRDNDLIKSIHELASIICLDETVDAACVLETFKDIGNSADVLKNNANQKIQWAISDAIKKTAFIPTIFPGRLIHLHEVVFWRHRIDKCFITDMENMPGRPEDNKIYARLAPPEFNKLEDTYKNFYSLPVYWLFDDQNVQELKDNIFFNNKTKDGRRNIFKALAGYGSEQDTSLNYENFKTLEIFTSSAGEIVTFEKIEYYFSKDFYAPQFLKPEIEISKESINFINKYLSSDNKEKDEEFDVPSQLKSRSISSSTELLRRIADEDDHNIIQNIICKPDYSAYELFAFLYDAHDAETTKDINWEFLGRHLCFHDEYRVEGRLSEKCSDLYFSDSWLDNNYLSKWIQYVRDIDIYDILRLESYTDFKDKVDKFRKNVASGRKPERWSKKTAFKLLSEMGVSYSPKIYEHPENYLISLKEYSLYKEYFPNQRFQTNDKWIPGIELYLSQLESHKSLESALYYLEKLSDFRAKTDISNRYDTRQRYISNSFLSFLQYQLSKGRWIQSSPTIINADGLYMPSEIFIDGQNKRYLPTLDDAFSKNKDGRDDLIKGLRLTRIQEKSLKNWKSIIETATKEYHRYKELHKDDKAFIGLRSLYEEIFNRLGGFPESLKTIPIPVRETENKIEFTSDSVFYIDDIGLDTDIHQRLFDITGLPCSAIPIVTFKGNDNLYTKLSDVVDVDIDFSASQSAIMSEVKNKWVVLTAICEVRDCKLPSFEAFNDKVVLCNSLTLNFNKLAKPERESSNYIESATNNSRDVRQYVCRKSSFNYIAVDENNYDNLWKLLTSEINSKNVSFSLIKSLMEVKGEEQMERFLVGEELSPDIVSEYEYIRSSIAETEDSLKRSDEITGIKLSEQSAEKTPEVSKKATNRPTKSPTANTPESTSKTTLVSPSNRGTLKLNKGTGRIPSGRARNKLTDRGHLRASDDTGRSARPAFDDESSDNKAIGDLAETYVEQLLKEKGFESVALLGGNNEGYDIEYKIGGITKFVEVKGLKGSWADSDVMLSKSQFKKAQLEKHNFAIYVVEDVDVQNGTVKRHTVIENPAKYFTKLQLDVGWRDFAPDQVTLKPQAGYYMSLKIHPEKRHEIENVEHKGVRTRLYLTEGKRWFLPDEMLIHRDGESND